MFPQCGNPGKGCPRVPRSREWHDRPRSDGRPRRGRQPPPIRGGRGATGLGPRPAGLLGRSRRDRARPRAAQPRAPRTPRRAPGPHRRRGTASTPARPTRTPTPPSSARSATCSTSRRTWSSRPPVSTTRWPPSPDRSWWSRCSTPASRPTRSTPAGARCTTPSTAPTSSPTDGELAPGDSYNKARGDEVIARGRAFLDEHFPLASGSHADATSYAVDDQGLAVTVKDDAVRLADPAQLVGFRGDAALPRGRPAGAPPPARRDPGRPRGRDRRRPTRPGSRTSCSSRPSPRSWTSRTRWRRSTPTTRCSATATGCASTRARSPRRSPRAARPSPGR